MGTIIKVGEVAVEVDAIAVVSSGTVDGVVAAVVGAVRVGAGENENVEVVQQVDDA